MGRFFAAVYDRFTEASEQACVRDWRRDLLAGVSGTVVEIGAGTGHNLGAYPDTVERLVLVEPDRHMRVRLEDRLRTTPVRGAVEVVDGVADALPVPDGGADAVVSTLVLCSVPDQARALHEVRRALRPGGRLVFLEHVRADHDPRRSRWQRRLTPIWRRVADGCHLDRDTQAAIERAGFRVEQLQRESMRKAAPVVRTTIRGWASPA